jgi:OCT family organic cation transporter-like MFS transporter 18
VSFGHLQTVFAIAQLVGGFYGRLGDLFGERTFSSSVLTYLLTGVSYSLPILFLSRIPSVFLHVMQGSQMVVTALSSDKDRAAALARLGFSYGIGMVIGPTIGGLVTTNFGEYAAAFLAAAGSSISLLLVILYVPNIPKQVQPDSNQSVLNFKKIFSLILQPKAGSLLLVKTVCGIPIGIMQSMFSLIAMEQFKLPADQNGMLLSYIGALSMFMQGRLQHKSNSNYTYLCYPQF